MFCCGNSKPKLRFLSFLPSFLGTTLFLFFFFFFFIFWSLCPDRKLCRIFTKGSSHPAAACFFSGCMMKFNFSNRREKFNLRRCRLCRCLVKVELRNQAIGKVDQNLFDSLFTYMTSWVSFISENICFLTWVYSLPQGSSMILSTSRILTGDPEANEKPIAVP